nr:MAG: hypothetical protein [Bacteriophage sp.]
MVETRKNEIRYVTSDPSKMLNKYLAKRVIKTWEESFIDEDTGETVNIERNEVLFERGTLIDQDILAKIRFSMEADGIKEWKSAIRTDWLLNLKIISCTHLYLKLK